MRTVFQFDLNNIFIAIAHLDNCSFFGVSFILLLLLLLFLGLFNLSISDLFTNVHTFSKTLLKLTIPRIKLLRNRREIQLKNMRREIAKLLETGQEATARIRVYMICIQSRF